MKRILIVSYEYPPLGGGGGVIFRDLAQALARRLEVAVLTSGARGLPERERHGSLEIVRAPVWLRRAQATASLPSMLSFYPSSLRHGEALFREKRWDLVHSSFAVPSGPSGLRLARRHGLRHVLSVHGGDIWDPSKRLSPHRTPLLKQTVRWVIHGSDRVVAQSSDTAERTRAIYGAPRVDVVPLAVERPAFEPAPRSDLGLPEDARVLVSVGRLVARKGLAELLDIVGRIDDPDLRLVLVGDGPERQALEARAAQPDLAGRVSFRGYVDEAQKWRLLEAADLYVSTCQHEGFGIGFLEGLACGTPVLCYDRGGQVDFIDDQVGALVRYGDVAGFEACLRAHLADAGLRARKAEAGRRRAREYGIERFAERYLEIYEACLRAPSPT